MALRRILIKIATRVINEVIGIIAQQLNRLAEQVLGVIEQEASNLESVWQAEGSDQFRQDLQTAITRAEQVITITRDTATGLDDAHERMLRADNEAAQRIQDLNNIFTRI